jgi:hypothetical protein
VAEKGVLTAPSPPFNVTRVDVPLVIPSCATNARAAASALGSDACDNSTAPSPCGLTPTTACAPLLSFQPLGNVIRSAEPMENSLP